MYCLVIFVLFTAAGAGASGREAFQPARVNEVTSLPGYTGSKLPSRHFTGHVPVHGGEHLLWYWLVESEGEPSADPVVLWLTGGPGCSSMDALIYENGPFTFSFAGCEQDRHGAARRGIRLTRNRYSWSKVTTMLYVDSPVGSGLSYAPSQQDISTDDQQTTDDLVDFITQLLTQDFPELQQRDLYIAGESYAGVYIPLLASKLLAYNKKAAPHKRLNLKGYSIGNGVTDDEFDGNGQPEFAYSLGLIDPPTYQSLQSTCNNHFWNATPGGACAQALHDAYDRFYWLNPYDILEDCYERNQDDDDASMCGMQLHPGVGKAGPRRLLASRQRGQGTGQRKGVGRIASTSVVPRGSYRQQQVPPFAAALSAAAGQSLTWPLSGVRSGGLLHTWHQLVGHSVPCSDRRIALQWLGRDDVRAALHAPSVDELDWQPCSDHIHYDFAPSISMIPYHMKALNAGLKVLIYSGDHDFVVPFTGTRDWVYSLGLPIIRQYAPWTIDGQVAGFLVEFENGLQFATVKGAGHMVPQTSPSRALHLITRFVSGNL